MSDCVRWKGRPSSSGYGRKGQTLAHRYVWALANGPIPKGMQVLHRCDNRMCVNVEHLFLGDNAANVADKVAKGRQSRLAGEKHPLARLKEADVLRIRSLHGVKTQRALAAEYGVSCAAINSIQQRKLWRHV